MIMSSVIGAYKEAEMFLDPFVASEMDETLFVKQREKLID